MVKGPKYHEHSRHPEHDEHGHSVSHSTHSHVGAHAHAHHRHDHSHSQAPQAIKRAIFITIAFMVLELIGGFFSNSLALMSDAAHLLTDVGAMLLSLFAIWISRKPVTPTMSFGYQRAEILGALTSGLVIWLISGLLVYEAVLRLHEPPPVNALVVILVASIGFAANLISMRMLHSAKHSNMNVRAAYVHMIADSIGSIGAIIAGLTLFLTGWRPIDPIISIVFAGLMLISSWELVKEAVSILMESTPAHLDAKKVRADLQSIPGVQEAHDLHIWTVSSGRPALSVHLISAESPDAILAKAIELLKSAYGIVHTTIQIEHPDRFQSERCYDCAPIEMKPIR